ncbi:Uncharacterized conserved protein, DUF2236 family [Friedmanniella luteola]|uniref:Uncharacterized conserved protein, DUF2236 family n=1 Tax=Friedmanniella luteola TaxID=546871 RepID=A0A1H1LGV7_9ACTN|nr:oxygenase MpaB family protein [Friedmanniella luteola]SDR73794.1 Uncharacterized conserved protein, DUF2236 family [Friedmanniella luteola]
MSPLPLDPRPLIGRQRAGLARMLRDRVGGAEFDESHERIWFTEGERWFSESDVIWQVHADTSMFIGGIRALLLQSLHPVAMQGVSEHSGFRGDPWGRLQNTSRYLATTTYGTVEDAERIIRIVQAIHKRVTGTTPAGRPYAASDPHLLGWVHAAQVDSFVATFQAFGHRRLTDAEVDAYVAQSGEVAGRLGVVDPPQTWEEILALLASYRPELRSTPAARDVATLLLRDPPLTGPARLGFGVLAAGAVATLPPWVRSTLRLPTLPATDRLLVRPLARSAVVTLRWALSDTTGLPQRPQPAAAG